MREKYHSKGGHTRHGNMAGNALMAGTQRQRGTILLATDFSKPAQRAFQYAMRLADTLAVRLVVLPR